jgi:hypothetical protein
MEARAYDVTSIGVASLGRVGNSFSTVSDPFLIHTSALRANNYSVGATAAPSDRQKPRSSAGVMSQRYRPASDGETQPLCGAGPTSVS